ncbi:MAG: RluA family pseudouridine synthase [Oscillospiraceae bacterium]
MEILYEDRECLACVKPAGVLSHKGKPGEQDMVSLLEARRRAGGDLGGVYLIHRLDREVGGVMLFAKSHGAAERLARASEKRQLRKEYLAVLRGVPAAPGGTLRDWLARDEKQRKTICVDRAHRGAKEAVLSYRVLETCETEAGPLSLARILLHTGRNHQIRVQFASRGTPVLGDGRYGGGEEGGMALWAFRLTFPDASGAPRTAAALPAGGVWERFAPEKLTAE